MKGLLVILIFTSGFGQINWEIEVVDSKPGELPDFKSNHLAVNTYNIPYVVYNKKSNNSVICAYREDSTWQKEVVESGLTYGYFSLIIDENNIPHLSYDRMDEATKMTYICYARREIAGWQIQEIDSFISFPIGWSRRPYSSIDLDTSGLPGVTYITWNANDSLCYIKFAHYNSINWDTSQVQYDDSALTFNPSLKFDSRNRPYIAFQQYADGWDTLKITHYNDTLNQWITESILVCPGDPGAGYPVSLQLNSQGFPSIAHRGGAGYLFNTWWDGTSWQPEPVTAIGWYDIKICLDLDSLNNPHIVYLPSLLCHLCYCYKKDTTWNLCGMIDPDTSGVMDNGDVSFTLDNYDLPHVCYRFSQGSPSGSTEIRYAKGTFVGIGEEKQKLLNQELRIYPNPASGPVNLDFPADVEQINIFDATGRLLHRLFPAPHLRLTLPPGIYFLQIKTQTQARTEKIIILK